MTVTWDPLDPRNLRETTPGFWEVERTAIVTGVEPADNGLDHILDALDFVNMELGHAYGTGTNGGGEPTGIIGLACTDRQPIEISESQDTIKIKYTYKQSGIAQEIGEIQSISGGSVAHQLEGTLDAFGHIIKCKNPANPAQTKPVTVTRYLNGVEFVLTRNELACPAAKAAFFGNCVNDRTFDLTWKGVTIMSADPLTLLCDIRFDLNPDQTTWKVEYHLTYRTHQTPAIAGEPPLPNGNVEEGWRGLAWYKNDKGEMPDSATRANGAIKFVDDYKFVDFSDLFD